MDKADNYLQKIKEALEKVERNSIGYMYNYNGSKEKPYPVFVGLSTYNAFVEEGIVEEGDLVYSPRCGWCKLICQKPLPEGKYLCNEDGTITHIVESVNATQKKNKESMDKFLNNKYKKRRY